MNQKNKDGIVRQFKIGLDDACVIINQVTEDIVPEKDKVNGKQRFFSYVGSGVSLSRNTAMSRATCDICVLADDDMVYEKDYQEVICRAYEKYPDADLILFHFDYEDSAKYKKRLREGKVGYIKSMKFGAPQITFKRASLSPAGIRFDEEFGPGAGANKANNWGEDSIFLFDCIRSGLKIYYVPEKIAVIRDSGSTTWSKENTAEHFEQQGAIYYRMSSRWWRVLALQFVLRKRKIYGKDMSGREVYRAMVRGTKVYRREKKNG